MSCGIGRRHGLDRWLLWLWCRLAAVAMIQPLAWEPPYAVGGSPKKTKQKQNKTSDVTKKETDSQMQRTNLPEGRGEDQYRDRRLRGTNIS